MSDIADEAFSIEDETRMRALLAARQPIPAGEPGECEDCGDESPRLVGGRCARCRDGRNRPAPVVRSVERPAACQAESEPGPELHRGAWETITATIRAVRAQGEGPSAPSATVTMDEGREDVMGEAKQVNLKVGGELLSALEHEAVAYGGALGTAAKALIERGLESKAAVAVPAVGTPRQRMAALLDGFEALLTEQIEAAERAGDTSALEAQRDEAIARAEAAEARVAQMRSVLG